MLIKCYIVLTVFLSMLFLAKTVEIVLGIISGLGIHKSVTEEVIEEPEEMVVIKPRYDVDAFREKMKMLKQDEDGLYDVEMVPYSTSFTGVEILEDDVIAASERRRNYEG